MIAAPATLMRAVAGVFPELAEAPFVVCEAGWDSLALDVADRWIFKFPKSAIAADRLRGEAALLALIRPAVAMRVPELELYEQPILFSRHAKIAGAHLLADDYRRLDSAQRDRLASDMAQFYAELHAIDRAASLAAGAVPVHPWASADALRRVAVPLLPEALRVWALAIADGWEALPPDPFGDTFGYFDGHGWNMAFDHEAGRLNGLYDFADSGIGPLHREFCYSNWIDRDLTRRIVRATRALTGRVLDEARIETLSGVLRLSELTQQAANDEHRPLSLQAIAAWVRGA
ncbi:MAG: aminoglycoside phosphotransferase family protein [Alphaproteobacteria bacterium]|nr:aminoglycoside phosphotransferase family protein [Alphaproteobacteria bacterium]